MPGDEISTEIRELSFRRCPAQIRSSTACTEAAARIRGPRSLQVKNLGRLALRIGSISLKKASVLAAWGDLGSTSA